MEFEFIDIEQKESDLVEKSKILKPKYESKEKAITHVLQDLESLASKHNQNIEFFLKSCEESSIFNEDFALGLALQRKLNFLKK